MMTWMSYLTQLGSGIFVLPLILIKFDSVDVSFWLLVTTLIGLATLADSGFGPTLIRAVSYFKAGADTLPENEEDYLAKESIIDKKINYNQLVVLLKTSGRIYMIISIILIVLLLTAGVALIWNIMDMAGHRQYLWISYALLMANAYFLLLTIRYSSFMQGLDYVAELGGINSLIGGIKITVFIIMLIANAGIAALMAYMLFETVVRFLIVRNFVRSWFSNNGYKIDNKPVFDRPIFRVIWSSTWKLGGIFWGNYMINYGNSIIISQGNNPAMIASFLFTQRIVNFIRNISQAPFYANVPKIYNLTAQKNNIVLKLKTSEYIFSSLFILAFALLVFGLSGNQLLNLLNVETRLVPPLILFIMSITVLTEMHAGFHSNLYISTNEVPFLWPTLISGVLILVMGFMAMPVWGILGIVLVQFVVQLSFNNWYPVYLSLRLLDWPLTRYLKDVNTFGFTFLIKKATLRK